jgi:hypothetical protein
MADKVKGLAEAYSLFGRLPNAARDQLGVELAIIGREILAEQRQQVAKDTGALSAGLSLWLMLEQLRVRVGLIGLRGSSRVSPSKRAKGRNYGNLFYGRFVEFGRRAQTVLVQRRRRVATRTSNYGILRTSRGRKVTADIVSTYSLKVKARDPHPYIKVEGAQDIAAGQLAEFWSRTFGRAEGNV